MDEKIDIPEWFFEIAKQVHGWLSYPKLREHFQAASQSITASDRQFYDETYTYNVGRQVHIETLLKLLKKPTSPSKRRVLLRPSKTPPKSAPDYVWDFDLYPLINGEESGLPIIEGWFPPALCQDATPKMPDHLNHPERLLSEKRYKTLSLGAKYHILATCHSLAGLGEWPPAKQAVPMSPEEIQREIDRIHTEGVRPDPYDELRRALVHALTHCSGDLEQVLDIALLDVSCDVEKRVGGRLANSSAPAPSGSIQSEAGQSPDLGPTSQGVWFGPLSKNKWAKLLCGYKASRWDRNVLQKWPDIKAQPADPESKHPCNWYVSPDGLPLEIAKKVRSQPHRLE